MEAQRNPAEQPSKIFINPKFAKAHINPMFLASNGALGRPEEKRNETTHQSKIHLNPAFLEKLRAQQVTSAAPATTNTAAQASTSTQSQNVNHGSLGLSKIAFSGTVNPIIKNTRRKLVRVATTTNVVKSGTMMKSVSSHQQPVLAPLVRIGKNKLVRSLTVPTVVGVENVKPQVPERKSLRIDRRLPPARISPLKSTFVKRYALSRINGITPKKVVITDPKLLKLKRVPTVKSPEKSALGKSTIAYASKNKQLVLVNINGVLYRSSTNKLQKSVPRAEPVHHSPAKHARNTKEHFLIIRGMRFALDRTGMKLRSVGSSSVLGASASGSRGTASEPRLNRIDIGGLTYKARKDGTFIRTDNHRTRNHLSTAKQRSIQVLASKLKKCNEPCHIYRRLGKCLAHQRGKCPKVHDPKHVSICQKFLRGECILDGCLLSHEVSLEKMPVCRFFLEGRCVRDVCPYLHKKVSEKERICDAFLNGFCPLADKCPNRHVFQCPEYERHGKCDRVKCPYPHGRKEPRKKNATPSATSTTVPVKQNQSELQKQPEPTAQPLRYYSDDGRQSTADNGDQTGELSASERNQLSRMLGEVDKMKQRYKDDVNERTTSEDEQDQIVSIENDPTTTAEGKCSDSPAEDAEDTRPLVLRRKALGTLPAFIPI
uniref:C3H1-type domain-containing protein n=1 Tax=Anopheles dirus TaxID=7168 RepID=A0A182NH48_9DIPT